VQTQRSTVCHNRWRADSWYHVNSCSAAVGMCLVTLGTASTGKLKPAQQPGRPPAAGGHLLYIAS
jgi:hypothetical protein